MTACTQPACTGTIVDGYCDVCGSPAGAAPFIPAVSAASAAAPTGRTVLAAGHGESGFSLRLRNCTQRGCIGTIVDGYCDVCGSPAGAPPFIPAGAAARQPHVAEEETATQLIPRVQMTLPPSAQEIAASAAADLDDRPTQLRDDRVSSCRSRRETDPADTSGADDDRAAV
jgi:serine/threonine-protein kinase PknG